MDTAGRRGNPSQSETDVHGSTQRNVDIVESRRNGPQPSTRHDADDDDDDGDRVSQRLELRSDHK